MATFLDRLLGRPQPRVAKAVTDISSWANNIPLSLYSQEPQEKAAAYLKAYKVGWFYKAGKKIADDVSTLDWSVSTGDMEEGEAETTLPRPGLRLPFRSLSPIDQFQRLLEAPVVDPATGRILVTGRQLLRKTEVRLDFAGAAFWYLENATMGLPTAIYGVSPTRMWPSRDSRGKLIGWVMDYNSPTPVPFDVSEILAFSNGNADDDDIWGVSVVEAVFAQVPLTGLLAQHTADTLRLGGRLSGMLWPKERALSEDEYVDAQRAWRNVASDPNAARRMLIFPEPMEWQQGAATPKEIGIPELANLTRDEILTAFPISPYRLGVPTPGGLNSGETRREDRKDYWEETIHPRADLIEETVQVGLLSRYEAETGQTYDFEIAEPDMDDAPTLLEKTAAYKGLVSIGLDPKESLGAVGLGHITWLGLPSSMDPTAPPLPTPMSAGVTASDEMARETVAQPILVAKSRESVAETAMTSLTRFFREQRDRVAGAIAASLPTTKAGRKEAAKSDPEWWDAFKEDRELAGALRIVYDTSARQGLQTVADQLDRTVLKPNVRRITDDLIQYGGSRISDINARTLDALKTTLAEGVRRGYSISQLIDGVPAENFSGILNVGLDTGVAAWGDARAEMIARTETALSYNRAAIDGYKEFNVQELEAIDGDGDPECAERNGQVFSVEEALAIEDHPNGTLDWVPVLDKAVHDDRMADVAFKALDLVARPQPDIHVHTTPPDVKLPTPIVNVEPPDLEPIKVAIEALRDDVKALKPPVVNVPAPVVNIPAPVVTVKAPAVTDVRVTALPERTHRIVRDRQGKPTGSVETDAQET